MKKAIFTVLVVLVALLVVTCDSAVSTMGIASNSTIPTRDEPGFVTLSIGISDNSRARALTNAGNEASSASNFYEVVFTSPGGQVYRQTWDTSATPVAGDGQNTFRITVAEGDYNNSTGTGKAIMFAGRKSDNTLLGIGEITATNAASDAVIGTGVSTVTFALSPLTAAVNTTSTGSGASSFLITGPTSPTDYSSASKASIDTVSPDSGTTDYPVFKVPEDSSDITATYLIECARGTEYAIVSAAGTVHFTAIGPLATVLASTTSANAITGGITTLNDGSTTIVGTTLDDVITDGGFCITITTPDTEDYSKLWIEVPVYAITTDAAKPNNGNANSDAGVASTTWNIRGGLVNTTVDDTTGGSGGAVLLEVGTAPSEVEHNVTATTPPSWT